MTTNYVSVIGPLATTGVVVAGIYANATDLKTYLNIDEATDDSLLDTLLAAAQQAIDSYCARVFEKSTDETRYFDAYRDVEGRTLYLDRDLCSITTITNGDGVEVAANEYVTEPRNGAPYDRIRLLSSSSKSWTYITDPENAISIVGRWAYATSAPDDISHACVRLAAYYYRQRDAQVFDTTATPELGVITIPQGMPADVKILLDPYRRLS